MTGLRMSAMNVGPLSVDANLLVAFTRMVLKISLPAGTAFAEPEQLVAKTEATIRRPFKQADLGERSQERVRGRFGKRQGLGNLRRAPIHVVPSPTDPKPLRHAILN